MWPVLIGQAIRWGAITAVSYMGYDTVKDITAPAKPEPHPVTGQPTTDKQARFVRISLMVALGMATLAITNRVVRVRRRR